MNVDIAALNPLEAHELVLAFAAQRGESALRLALHAAVPQVLRPDLLHLLRLNFVSDAPSDGSAAEADVLFAPFCEDIGNGYFRFAGNARRLLLRNLDPTYPDESVPRSARIGRFLAAWIDQQSRSAGPEYDALYAEYLEVERWSALGFLDADAAAAQLADAIRHALAAEETVARMRVGSLVAALSTPLGRYSRLLAYAAGLDAAQAGNAERARDLLYPLGKQALLVGAVRLDAPSEVLRKYVGTQRASGQRQAQAGARESEVAATDKPSVSQIFDADTAPWRPAVPAGAIYIIFRHGASAEETVRLGSFLRGRFGQAAVVWDLLPDELPLAMAAAHVALVVIGPDWLDPDETSGSRLPAHLRDLEVAMQDAIPIVPVLVRGARPPHPDELPASLRPFAELEAIALDDSRWEADCESLVEWLEELFTTQTGAPRRALATSDMVRRPYSIFISYAHEDERFKDELVQHLAGINRQGLIASWDDREIEGGDAWREKINDAMNVCDLAVLLISPAFIASGFINESELPELVKRRQSEGIRVLPVIVRSFAWHLEEIDQLQVRPKDGKALASLRTRDARDHAWTIIVQEIAGWARAHQASAGSKPWDGVDDTVQRPATRLRIHVSFTREDLAEYGAAVVRTLAQLGHSTTLEDVWPSQAPTLQRALIDIAHCDVFALIVGWSYRPGPPHNNPEQLSIDELEYRRARELGKPCLVFLLQPDPAALQSIERDTRLSAFRTQLARERNVWFFTTVQELEVLVIDAVRRLERDVNDELPSSQTPSPAASPDRPKTRSEAIAAAYGRSVSGMELNDLVVQMNKEMNAFIAELVAATDLPVREGDYFFLGRLGEGYERYPFNWEPFRDFAGPLLRYPDSIPVVMVSALGVSTIPPSASREERPRPHYRIFISPSHAIVDIVNVWLETLADDRSIPQDGGDQGYSWFFRNLGIAPEQLSAKARRFVNSFPSQPYA